jgi:hypothetical protein
MKTAITCQEITRNTRYLIREHVDTNLWATVWHYYVFFENRIVNNICNDTLNDINLAFPMDPRTPIPMW